MSSSFRFACAALSGLLVGAQLAGATAAGRDEKIMRWQAARESRLGASHLAPDPRRADSKVTQKGADSKVTQKSEKQFGAGNEQTSGSRPSSAGEKSSQASQASQASATTTAPRTTPRASNQPAANPAPAWRCPLSAQSATGPAATQAQTPRTALTCGFLAAREGDAALAWQLDWAFGAQTQVYFQLSSSLNTSRKVQHPRLALVTGASGLISNRWTTLPEKGELQVIADWSPGSTGPWSLNWTRAGVTPTSWPELRSSAAGLGDSTASHSSAPGRPILPQAIKHPTVKLLTPPGVRHE